MRSRLLLTFSPELAGQPIIYQLVQQFRLELNILRASIDHNVEGKLLLEVAGGQADVQAGKSWLLAQQVRVAEVGRLVTVDESTCVHCGACTAVCSPQALQLNPATWLLELDSQKCVACAACADACPLQCIRLV